MEAFKKTPPPANADLSSEIVKAVERLPDDIVRCTRVNDNLYRCNWWSIESTANYDNPSMNGGQIGTTHRIRQSQFLCVTQTADGLRIAVVSGDR